MARIDWQYVDGSTNNNSVFFTGIRWRYRDDLFGTTGYPTSRESSNTDIIEYQPYIGRKQNYNSYYYQNWLTSNYKYSYNTTSGSDPEIAGNQLNVSTTYHFERASINTKYYLTTGSLSSSNVMNTSSSTISRIIQVPHCSDGTSRLRLYFYFAGNSGTSFTSAETNVIVTLETIPRASAITVNDANIGSGTSIIINKASSDFTTTVYYKVVGENSWREPAIVTKTSEPAYGWIVPTSLYSEIPTSQTIQCLFKADTYSGNTLVGSYETPNPTTFTATGNPVISNITKEDFNSTTTALTGDRYNKMIKYASDIIIGVTAYGINGSQSDCTITVNGVTAVSGLVRFYSCTTNTFNIVVTDSRGYSTYQTVTMSMVDYIPLTINADIKRNQPTDGIIKVNLSGNYFNWTFGETTNTLTVEYRYRESSASSWTQDWTSSGLTTTTSGNTYTSTVDLTNMDYTKSYQFEVRAMDEVYTSSNPVSIIGINVTKGIPIYNWDENNFNVNVNFNLPINTLSNNSNLNDLVNNGYWTCGGNTPSYSPNNAGWGGVLLVFKSYYVLQTIFMTNGEIWTRFKFESYWGNWIKNN